MQYTRLALAIGLTCLSLQGQAQEYSFDASLLDTGSGGSVDVSLFEQGGQLPGTYPVDIILNGERVDARDVVFTLTGKEAGKPVLVPCLDPEQLIRYGVKTDELKGLQGDGRCADLSAIPGGQARLDFNSQSLQLSIPQIYLRPRLQGLAPESLWNDGVPAFLLNWQANTTRTENRGGESTTTNNSFAQLQPGLNIGPWRVRNNTTWTRSDSGGSDWESNYIYAERGLNAIKSRLTLGERDTPSDVFDSVPFSGVMLNSDESMVPGNQSGYSPVVRGIARTQARVEVKQNGYTLYNATVAPGPFALNDLTPSGSGGDLEVTVHETDGSNQVFTVPYQTAAIALREGYLKYSMMAGRYRPADDAVDEVSVGQGTVMYGLPYGLTAYAGLQGAEHYMAGSLGLGVSLGSFGALSLDGTHARGERKDEGTQSGDTWRVRYSKDVVETRTSFALASYQYASSGYNTLSDVLDTWRDGSGGSHSNADRRKSRTSVTVSQGLGSYGFLTFSGYRDTYWNRSGHTNSLNAGWSVPLRWATVSVNWSENETTETNGRTHKDRVTSLWVSVPLGRWLGGDTQASYRLTDQKGGDNHELGLNGRALDRRLWWDVRQRMSTGDSTSEDNSSLNTSFRGTYGEVGGNYSYSDSVRQAGLNASGGMIIHPGGVTFGQSVSESAAVIEAPGASGVPVGGWPGIRTDFRGYTLLGGLTPYQENAVSLDPTRLPPDAEVTQTDVVVVPTAGAVVPARFSTRVGGRGMMTLTRPDGSVVPYGALTTLEGEGVGSGVVGDAGMVYLTGLPEKGQLAVKWAGHQCRAEYHLPEKTGAAGLYEMSSVCR